MHSHKQTNQQKLKKKKKVRPVRRGAAKTGLDLQHAADVDPRRLGQREEWPGHVFSRAGRGNLQGYGTFTRLRAASSISRSNRLRVPVGQQHGW